MACHRQELIKYYLEIVRKATVEVESEKGNS